MPSIVHRSALMQSRKLALTSQDFVEQGNGLVQVALGYTAAASDASSVLPLFRVDSQPPINPSIVSLNDLQSQKLYMTNFSSTQANGLLQITASYVGASLSALRKPLIFDSVERRTFTIRVASFRSTSLGWNYIYNPEPIPQIVRANTYINYDVYVIDAYLRDEQHQNAVIANESIDYAAPPVLSTNERAGLLMGATFTRRFVGTEFRADPYSGVVRSLPSSLSAAERAAATLRFQQYGDQKLPGFEFRFLTALQILEALASSSTYRTNAGMTVTNSTAIEHVTPTVRLISNVYELQLNSAPIFAKYGASIT
jgi:hypothetical protein